MSKKNKKPNSARPSKGTKQKGGSAITKSKPINLPKMIDVQKKVDKPLKISQRQRNQEKGFKKFADVSKKAEDEKISEAAIGKAGNKNKGSAKSNDSKINSEDSIVDLKTKNGESNGNGEVAGKITKRQKNRVKAEIKKEIILKGKSKTGLADIKLVSKKLAKLQAKAEPVSKKAQRKIMMLQQLQERLSKGDNKGHHKKNKKAASPSAAVSAAASSDGDEAMETDGQQPTKVASNAAAAAKPRPEQFSVFVGNLPKEATQQQLEAHFSSVGSIVKIKLPEVKKKKAKKYAFVQLADEEARQNILKMHGSEMGERKLTVMYADRGRSQLNKNNAKLSAIRSASLGVPQRGKNKKSKPNKKKGTVK